MNHEKARIKIKLQAIWYILRGYPVIYKATYDELPVTYDPEEDEFEDGAGI